MGLAFPEYYKAFNQNGMFTAGSEAIKSSEYTGFGRVTEFKYSAEIGNAFRGNNPIKYLTNFGKISFYPISSILSVC
jgi:alpha-amylase